MKAARQGTNLRWASRVFAAFLGACYIFFGGSAGLSRARQEASGAAGETAKITIAYPVDGSIFPPEITPPTFLWRDSSAAAKHWRIEVSFKSHANVIRVEARGELMHMGEVDPQASPGNELPQLTAEQAVTRTWKPIGGTWAEIKRLSVKFPATIKIEGFTDENSKVPVSSGSVTISTSEEPVGAPIFYRDVPLITVPNAEKAPIQPLPTSAIPLIKWRLRNIGEPQSRTVMEKLYTCANCHSFSGDGKTMGIDMDGPKNDKGLYALVPVSKNTVIRNQDMIRWSSFRENEKERTSEAAVKRFGFMSQVSPDGRYVVTSIGPPALGNAHQNKNPDFVPGLSDRLFSITYNDTSFIQVFYPTRGILALYDRKEEKLRPLPGADDPRFVQTSAFWSPDGRYLIFSRAEARDSYPPGAAMPKHANDPNETQIQYDLYRIPFNGGKGGKAEPVTGASGNGMSNSFPKVSPDGRWIVFVQCRNGLLMRPDSRLYIVPFTGGKARLMRCNTSLMNSWHTFSPNGRWLAFSSKARSPYTQLMLTYIDAQGNDSPAILVDNTTAANRAVNIPEFVNVAADGLENIDPQATEFYRLFNEGYELMEKNQMAEAIPVWRKALQADPEDALAHYSMATALSGNGQEREAVEEYRKACALNQRFPTWLAHLAVSQALTGDMEGAISSWRKSLELDPANPGTEADLGTALLEHGEAQEGFEHLRKAVEVAPDFADGHNRLGSALASVGQTDEAIGELQKAVALDPTSVEYRYNLGYSLGVRGDFTDAAASFEEAVQLSGGKDWRCLAALADAYSKSGRNAEAIQAEQRAVDVAKQGHDEQLEKRLRGELERYESQSSIAPQ
jgi:Flp pilus assembly protein TadD